MKLELAMIYRPAAYAFSALMMVSGVAADARPDANESQTAESDLTGYWKQRDGKIVHFTQDGSSLTSRYSKRSAGNDENDVDFTATVHGNLIYGAHRGPFSRTMQKKCSLQIWVGMGLTLSDDGTILEGFRGDRIVDPKTCSAKNSDPVKIVYKRIADADLLQ
ncbi:hypothetical protein [Parasphingorhabdus sp.]|jgi:hypothetical protein|uniref:hypothetical protein n=1 Tax=Parasphingorhabdus sp. TaxID=2709688 RepID=UPI00309F51C4